MSKHPIRLRTAVSLALVVAFLTGCSGTTGVGDVSDDCKPDYEGMETAFDGTLTVASYDFPPWTIIDGAELSGVEGDLLKEVAARQCLTLTTESAGGANASIPSVDTGRVDTAAGDWYRTKARAEVVRLSAPVYLDKSAVISTSGLNADELEGHRVASVVGNLWNESVRKWLGSDFVVYQDDESIYNDLAAGRIDAILASSATAQLRLEDAPIEGVTLEDITPRPEVPEFEHPGQAGWPTSYENEELGDILDKIIVDMHNDGTIDRVLKKWNLDPALGEVGDPYEL